MYECPKCQVFGDVNSGRFIFKKKLKEEQKDGKNQISNDISI
jgi:hypothetical protein